MRIAQLREMLFPSGAEADEGFHQEILSLSHRGLKIVAAVEIVLALIGLAGQLPWQSAATLLLIGVLTALAARAQATYSHQRVIGLASSVLAVALASRTIMTARFQDFALGAVVVLALTCAAEVPILPIQSLAIGAAALAGGFDCDHQLFLIMVALVALALSTALYSQRRTNYQSYLSVLQATQDFRAVQSRLLVAENSATMVRLSAALAHELSQPVAAASSSVDTLLAVSSRHATAAPEERARLVSLEQDLGRSLKTSLERLRVMVNRIQRLTNLDEAGTRDANLNELLKEAVALVSQSTPDSIQFRVRLAPLPDVPCRPQQLLTVFTTLLTNSLQAIDTTGEICITSRLSGDRAEIRFEDNGRGIPPERLGSIFDPGFQVADGRVSTGNWSLFTARQFTKEHSGDMKIQSHPGQGTVVTITLPCSS